jgi:hypothetical protein
MSPSAAIADSLLRRAFGGVLAVQAINILFQVCLSPSRLRLPVSRRDCAISRRSVMNNAG